MKIALQLSGFMNNHQVAYPTWYEHILSKYSVDVFIHTWNTTGTQQKTLIDSNLYAGMENLNPITMDEIRSLWKPVSLILDEYDLYATQFLSSGKIWMDRYDNIQKPRINNKIQFVSPKGTIMGLVEPRFVPVHSMMYKWWACNELRKQYEKIHNLSYDIIIRSRPDISLVTDIPESILFNTEILHFIARTNSAINADELPDELVIGSPIHIDYYCDMWNHISDLFNKVKDDDDVFLKYSNIHRLLFYYMHLGNIPCTYDTCGNSYRRLR